MHRKGRTTWYTPPTPRTALLCLLFLIPMEKQQSVFASEEETPCFILKSQANDLNCLICRAAIKKICSEHGMSYYMRHTCIQKKTHSFWKCQILNVSPVTEVQQLHWLVDDPWRRSVCVCVYRLAQWSGWQHCRQQSRFLITACPPSLSFLNVDIHSVSRSPTHIAGSSEGSSARLVCWESGAHVYDCSHSLHAPLTPLLLCFSHTHTLRHWEGPPPTHTR